MVHHANSTSGSLTYTACTFVHVHVRKTEALVGKQLWKATYSTYTTTCMYIWKVHTHIHKHLCTCMCMHAQSHVHVYTHVHDSTCIHGKSAICGMCWGFVVSSSHIVQYCDVLTQVDYSHWPNGTHAVTTCGRIGLVNSSMCEPHPIHVPMDLWCYIHVSTCKYMYV